MSGVRSTSPEVARDALWIVTASRLDLRGPISTQATRVLVRAGTLEEAAAAVRGTFPSGAEARQGLAFGPPVVVSVESASFLVLDGVPGSRMPWQRKEDARG